jgi:hypothetical protein
MVPIAGAASAGDRGISKVEVSTDDGTTCKDARLKDIILSNTIIASLYLPSFVSTIPLL